jgi:hypothetical protein
MITKLLRQWQQSCPFSLNLIVFFLDSFENEDYLGK